MEMYIYLCKIVTNALAHISITNLMPLGWGIDISPRHEPQPKGMGLVIVKITKVLLNLKYLQID